MKTRDIDLEKLDQGRKDAQTPEKRAHMEALLAQVYAQSKDPVLEGLRRELTDTLKSLEEQGEDQEKWNKYLLTIKKIEDYCNSPAFLSSMYKAIQKVSTQKEADLYAKSKT